MIGDVLYGSAENVEVKLLDFMTEIKASEFYKAIEEEESRENFSSNFNSNTLDRRMQ